MTYKPDTDDVRETPAFKIISELIDINIDTEICEPNLIEHKDFKLSSFRGAVSEADIVCILVKHKEFISNSFKALLQEKTVLDFCGATFENSWTKF